MQADSRFTLSQWDTALLCNDVSHWLVTNVESALNVSLFTVGWIYIYCGQMEWRILFSHKSRPAASKNSVGMWTKSILIKHEGNKSNQTTKPATLKNVISELTSTDQQRYYNKTKQFPTHNALLKWSHIFAPVLVYKQRFALRLGYLYVIALSLTHWGRVTHICDCNLTIIGSDNGLSPGRHQAIIWTNAGI